MGEVTNMHGQPVQLADDLGFVVDLARFQENLLDEKTIP